MDKKVCKCGHSDIIHEYYTDTCHAKGCSCLSFQEPNSDPPSPEMVCPNCKGTGYKTKTNGDFTPGFRCANCHGTGKVTSPEMEDNYDEHEHADGTIHSHRQGAYAHIHKVGEPVPSPEMVCPQCEGVGHWLLASMGTAKVCPKCNGTGKVPSPEPPEKKE